MVASLPLSSLSFICRAVKDFVRSADLPCVRWHFYPREESFSVSYQMEQPSFAANQVVDWRLMSSFHCSAECRARYNSLNLSPLLFDRLSLSNECCGMARFAYLCLQLTLMHLRHLYDTDRVKPVLVFGSGQGVICSCQYSLRF